MTYLPNADDYETFKKADFQSLHDQHWRIEQYHRMIKQVCNIERFQVRTKGAILTHIFASICSFVHLQQMTFCDLISNAYQWKRELFNPIIEKFIRGFIPGKSHLQPQFHRVVNA
ncbi:MAG: transposase [Rhodoferax sp.]|nr:transposase [Rhodoferax sp.]